MKNDFEWGSTWFDNVPSSLVTIRLNCLPKTALKFKYQCIFTVSKGDNRKKFTM